MNRKLTARSSLENLRKEAKRWLSALREGDPEARERLHRAWPGAPAVPALRDVQHALAQELGLRGWAAIKDELAAIALASRNHEMRVAEFLEHSCLHYGVRPGTTTWDRAYGDEPSRWRYAARILARHPEIGKHSIHTAAVSGDLAEVERILAANPGASTERGGPQGWEPLLHVCYGRLPLPAVAANSVAIAQRLLDAGANVNASLPMEGLQFGTVTGAIGHGERSQPPHPQAPALAALLIDRGANPFDAQALYNTSLEGDDVFWLDFLYERSAALNEVGKWTDPSLWGGGIVNYLLGNAASRNDLRRVRWLLAHGANPDTKHAYTNRKMHTEAVLLGHIELADLLVRAGGTAEPLHGHDAFHVACMRLDRQGALDLARENPAFLNIAAPLIAAASGDRLEVARFLVLDAGMPPNVSDEEGFTPLHAAAMANAVNVAAFLIERGAAVDPLERRFNGTPLGAALYTGAQQSIAMLGALSRHPRSLVRMGNVDRLRQLIAIDPDLAKTTDEHGSLLAVLPDDEDLAEEVAEFLLAHGADPRVRDKDGLNAMQVLERRGLEALADQLRETFDRN